MSVETCTIIDFGSQYTQLIARRLRELNVYSEIKSPQVSLEELRALNTKALILSGGPASVKDAHSPRLQFDLNEFDRPVLGICYGMQLMAHELGGVIESGRAREYGVEEIVSESSLLLDEGGHSVLLSHGDHVKDAPKGFRVVARSKNNVIAAIESETQNHFGLQFHPEVVHTKMGTDLLKKFLTRAGFAFSWSPEQIYTELEQSIRKHVPANERILCAVSGGVDSTVLAVLLNKVLPGQVDCICVDTGLLRKNEILELKNLFEGKFHFPIQILEASNDFLSALRDVTDPEKKRKLIGGIFIDLFEREAKQLKEIAFLSQGTLYPDVIESVSAHGGPSVKIKSHHNVGGLPEKLALKLLEPFRLLFKDEVRMLGEFLGMPHDFVWRHPFPGPGLAVRVVGEVTEERLSRLREADWRLQAILKDEGIYESLWQSFAVYLPIQSVGVMGDSRTYENCVAIRLVHSDDGMTAHICDLPMRILEKISSRIINEVAGINRVVYDISSKPPSTIEWE